MATVQLNPYNDSYIIEYRDGDVSLERNVYNASKKVLETRSHTVLPGETIQGIAFKYYGDPGLWGQIADYNSIYDVMDEVVEGMELLIPLE